jgi:hypothetical protein
LAISRHLDEVVDVVVVVVVVNIIVVDVKVLLCKRPVCFIFFSPEENKLERWSPVDSNALAYSLWDKKIFFWQSRYLDVVGLVVDIVIVDIVIIDVGLCVTQDLFSLRLAAAAASWNVESTLLAVVCGWRPAQRSS